MIFAVMADMMIKMFQGGQSVCCKCFVSATPWILNTDATASQDGAPSDFLILFFFCFVFWAI